MMTEKKILELQQIFKDKLLLLIVCLSIVIGSLFGLLFPCFYGVARATTFIVLINMLLVYPVLEEYVFRGVIQHTLLNRECLRRRYYGVSRANLITSCLFVAFHLFQQPLLFAIWVFIPSIIFGYFKERYSTLIVPIGLHILFNGVFLLASSQAICG